jgi:hypothetical protein
MRNCDELPLKSVLRSAFIQAQAPRLHQPIKIHWNSRNSWTIPISLICPQFKRIFFAVTPAQ